MWLRTVLICCLCSAIALFFWLGSRQNATLSAFNTYSERLANVLDEDAPVLPAPALVALPLKRELQVSLPDVRIGLMDAYELRKCNTLTLVADRNSALGKVQGEMAQLQYELRLLSSLQHCIDSVSEELATELSEIAALKQKHIHAHLWNAVTLNDEWQTLLRPTVAPFGLEDIHGFAETEHALTTIAEVQARLEAAQPLDEPLIDALMTRQAEIFRHDYIGRLYASLRFATVQLDALTYFLNQHDSKVICGQNINQQRAKILQNVFHRFYIDTLQPYLADLNGQYVELQPLLMSVYQPPVAISDNFAAYHTAMIAGQAHHDFKRAIMDHTDYWKGLFSRCQLTVGTTPFAQ
uniref:DUF3080 family protein n=1 Tax=Thaumasiovibrio occultus TaxID=1891184 RepID=UPI000B3611E6|nr:DUF3080 family protein [Thaumasiovibrio occultus]